MAYKGKRALRFSWRSVLVAVALVAAANGADNTTTMTLTTTTAVPIVTATERTPDSSSCHLKEGGKIRLGASKEARQFTGAAFATLDSLGTIGSGTKQYRSSKLQAVPNTYYRISPLELPEGTVFPVGTDATNVKYDVSDYNCKKDGVDPCFISINNDDGTLVVFFPTPTTSGTTARSVTITVRSEEYKEETLFEKIEFRVANPVPFDVTPSARSDFIEPYLNTTVLGQLDFGPKMLMPSKDENALGGGADGTVELKGNVGGYPGAQKGAVPTGTITLRALPKHNKLKVSFNVTQLPRAAQVEIRIHNGSSCDDVSTIGDHYYRPELEDPWAVGAEGAPAAHTVDAERAARGSFVISTGYGLADNVGHAAVLQLQDGTPLGCAEMVAHWRQSGAHSDRGTGEGDEEARVTTMQYPTLKLDTLYTFRPLNADLEQLYANPAESSFDKIRYSVRIHGAEAPGFDGADAGDNDDAAPDGYDDAGGDSSNDTPPVVVLPGKLIDAGAGEYYSSPTDGAVQVTMHVAGWFKMEVVVHDAAGAEIVVWMLDFSAAANDLDSRSNSPSGKGCGASELNTHADAVPFDGFYSCNCSAGQSGNNCQNESPNADQSAAKQKKNGGKTAGLVILVLILIPTVAFGLLKLKVYIATRPFDFTEEVARLVDADRINPEKSRVPYEVSRSRLTMFCRIGDGAYSDIWKGAFASGEESEVVAIKTCPDPITSPLSPNAKMLLEEGVIMSQVSKHVNVMAVLGVVTGGSPIQLILPYCEAGNLQELLFARANPDDENAKQDSKGPPLTFLNKVQIVLQVAAGMAHLESNQVVHQDLAARSVMVVKKSLLCKVAGFGLPGRPYTGATRSEMADSGGGGASTCAVRWAAPEVLEVGTFTSKSDVWSFGVTVMEVVTDGARPYPGMDNATVAAAVTKDGKRMDQPDVPFCTIGLYCTLLDCWAEVANNRPSFETLVIFFKAMHEKGEPVAGALTREDMSMWVETTSFGPSGAVAVITPGASGGEDGGVEGPAIFGNAPWVWKEPSILAPMKQFAPPLTADAGAIYGGPDDPSPVSHAVSAVSDPAAPSAPMQADADFAALRAAPSTALPSAPAPAPAPLPAPAAPEEESAYGIGGDLDFAALRRESIAHMQLQASNLSKLEAVAATASAASSAAVAPHPGTTGAGAVKATAVKAVAAPAPAPAPVQQAPLLVVGRRGSAKKAPVPVPSKSSPTPDQSGSGDSLPLMGSFEI